MSPEILRGVFRRSNSSLIGLLGFGRKSRSDDLTDRSEHICNPFSASICYSIKFSLVQRR